MPGKVLGFDDMTDDAFPELQLPEARVLIIVTGTYRHRAPIQEAGKMLYLPLQTLRRCKRNEYYSNC